MSAREYSKSIVLAFIISLGISGSISQVPTFANPSEPKAISAELAPLLEKGYKHMIDGKYSAAVKTLTSAVKLDGDSITARRYLAYALVRDGQPLNAIKQLNLIVKQIKPTYFEWCTFGEAYLLAGGISQAQNCYEQAIKEAPTSSYAKSGLIRASVKSGNYDQALSIAEKGMKESKTTVTYDYFKHLYGGVRSQMLAHGGSGQTSEAPVPTEVAGEPLNAAAKQSSRVAQNEQQRKNQEMLKRITSSQGKVTNHPGG